MSSVILDNISLILLLPLWIFLIIMSGRFLGIYVNNKIIYLLTLLSSFYGSVVCFGGLKEIEEAVEWTLPFIKINDFSILFGIHVDKIALTIALLLFVISFFVQLFSVSYLKKEKKKYRFFALLNLFNFAMAFLIFSPNLFQFYVFWELVGVVSYLLVGFDYNKEAKTQAARRMFLLNRIGDTALIAGIIIVSRIVYNFSAQTSLTTLPLQDFARIAQIISAYTTEPMSWVICALFIIAAAVKSAQFPFHTWLQDAMEAKSPVSALLHSATMVIAGVYLLIRIFPLFETNEILLLIISSIGLVSAIMCSIFAILESHPKKTLAYSTSASIGLMFAAIGTVNITAAVIFLIAHALIKSMLFLLLPNEDNEISYTNIFLMVLGALSLAGIILSGFYAKEILYPVFAKNLIMTIVFAGISFLAAFYITKFVLLVYKNSTLVKKVDWIQLLSCVGILILNAVFYLYLKKHAININSAYFASLFGIFMVLVFYKLGLIVKIKPWAKLLEITYGKFIPYVYAKLSDGADFIERKSLYLYKSIIITAQGGVSAFNWLENNVMMKIVQETANLSKSLSTRDKILQTGNIQTYNAYAFIFVTIIITMVILGYLFLIGQLS